MLDYEQLVEELGQSEMAMISLIFWTNYSDPVLLPKNLHDHPDHPVWNQLNIFQNAWLLCKQEYNIKE